MKSLRQVFLLIFACSALGQVSGAIAQTQYTMSIHDHKDQIAQACGLALTNICDQLRALAQKYGPLSDIGMATTEHFGSSNSVNYRFRYSKNVRVVLFKPPTNTPTARSERSLYDTTGEAAGAFVVDKDGARLMIDINDAEGGGYGISLYPGRIYDLLAQGTRSKIWLCYSLQLNTNDAVLESAVADCVEKDVGILRKEFQDILASDPIAERAHACGAIMSNILSELKELQQHFPVLSEIGSSVIETKGDQYVYRHLRFWKNVDADPTTNAQVFQREPNGNVRAIRRGGVGMDIYVLNADEPFGLIPGNSYPVYSSYGKTKIELVYNLYFNREDELSDSSDVRDARDAIRGVIQKEQQKLRESMDNIISFGPVK